MDRLDRVLLDGDKRELVAIALSARQIAEFGEHCRCARPAVKGTVRICGQCLLNLEPAPRLPYTMPMRLWLARMLTGPRPVALTT